MVPLIRRKNEPFKGDYALPGGFVDIGETTEASRRREVLEAGRHRRGIGSISSASYPTLRAIRAVMPVSVAYTTRFGEAPTPKAGSDAEAAEWVKDWRTKRLAFDHSIIIADAEKLCSEG